MLKKPEKDDNNNYDDNNPENDKQDSFFKRAPFFLLLFLVAVYVVQGGKSNRQIIPYSDFKMHLERNSIDEVTFQGREILGVFKTDGLKTGDNQNIKLFMTQRPDVEDTNLMPLLEKNGIKVNAVSDQGGFWSMLLVNLLPWILIFGFFYYSNRRMKKGLGDYSKGFMGMGKTTAKKVDRQKVNTSFEDVAGAETAKIELGEIIDFLKNPERYNEMGAKLPKGVLMVGPPGTGKTLMARATAGEADVPFYSISASEFIEVYVGVGASRVRDLFENAKRDAPSIIFIDEIDAIGRSRGAGVGGGHDEREQTLNQILSEMDGFEQGTPVVVMAATNRPDVLDSALVRPGRFDRQITLGLPHKEARKKILQYHARKLSLSDGISFDDLAKASVGFSGAKLANWCNEAVLLAARKKELIVTMAHFDQARDKIILGGKREEKMQERDRRITAFHEAGHAVMAHFLPYTDPLRKVTIVPRGMALGVTEQMPEEERVSYSKKYLDDQVSVLLGGRIAEDLVFQDVTTGAENDLKRATTLARQMISNWGMNDKFGLMSVKQGETHVFLGKELGHDRDFSEQTAQLIDQEIMDYLSNKAQFVESVLKKQQTYLDKLACALLDQETLDSKEINEILAGMDRPQKAVLN